MELFNISDLHIPKVHEIKGKGYIPQADKASDIYFAIKKENKNQKQSKICIHKIKHLFDNENLS